MAVSLVTTIGSASANSYISLADAQTFIDTRPHVAAWTAATTDEKNRALATAARRLNDEDFVGYIVNTDPRQALAWPRSGAYDREGVYIEDDEIPQAVKDAQCELALVLLSEDLLADTGLEGFLNVSAGPVSVTPNHSRRAGALPVHVRRILDPLLRTPAGSVRLDRG